MMSIAPVQSMAEGSFDIRPETKQKSANAVGTKIAYIVQYLCSSNNP